MNIKRLCKWSLCAALSLAFWVIPAHATGQTFEPEITEIFEFQYDPLRQARPVASDAVSLLGRETTFEADHTSYRDQLDSEEKAAYDAIHEAVSEGEYRTEISLEDGSSDTRKERLYGIISAYYNDHPLETAVTTGRIKHPRFPGTSFVVELETFITDEAVADPEMDPAVMLAQLKAAVEDFYLRYTAEVAENATDLEKYQYAYEYITMQCSYNSDEISEPCPLSPTERETAHNAYGALVGAGMKDGVPYGAGNVVCEGYAKAYMVLCQRIGLPCVTIVGAANTVGNIPPINNHMWNAVKLDDEWFAVDATWDDYEIQMTPERYPYVTSQVTVETTGFHYFTDNRYFHVENTETLQDHQAYTQFEYEGFDWNMGSPELSNTRYAEECIIPQNLNLVLEAAEEKETAHFSDVFLALQNIDPFYQGWTCDNIPDVTIVLLSDTEFSGDRWYHHPMQIPDGYTYSVVRGMGATGSTITRGEGYGDSFFVVQPGGTLMLGGVTLDGSGCEATAPLIDASLSEDATGKYGLVYLLDSDAINNEGACGIDSDGIVLLQGCCMIENNTNAEGVEENLKLRALGVIGVTGPMTNSEIGVTAPKDAAFAWSADDYAWTEADRTAFRSDVPDLHFSYERVLDYLHCTNLYMTDDTQPVSFCWLEQPTLETVGTEMLYLRNHTATDQSVQIWAAMYDVNDRMILSVYLGDMVLESGEVESLSVPQAVEGTARYQLMALDTDSGCPLSETLKITE